MINKLWFEAAPMEALLNLESVAEPDFNELYEIYFLAVFVWWVLLIYLLSFTEQTHCGNNFTK